MTSERARELLAKPGAIIEGHFVGTNGNHLSVYVAKDRATRLTSISSQLCKGIAELFASDDIDAVVAPAAGGIALSQWTAYHLTLFRQDRPEVLALYSEHDDIVVFERKKGEPPITFNSNLAPLAEGEQIILRRPRFVLKRGFDVDISGKCVLELEDVLTTGGSAAKTADAIRSAGGILVGLAVLANGGNVTPETCHVERLEALMSVKRQVFTEEECADHGLCARGVPINTNFGHGKAFLARKQNGLK